MFSVQRLNPSTAHAGAAQMTQQVQWDCMQPAQVDDHFTQSEGSISGQEVPSPNSPAAKRTFNFTRLEEILIDQDLSIKHLGNIRRRRFLVAEITSLRQYDNASEGEIYVWVTGRVRLQGLDAQNYTLVNQ